MTTAKKKKTKTGSSKSTNRKAMLARASIASVALPKIKIQPPNPEGARERREDVRPVLPDIHSAAPKEEHDQVVARLTEGLSQPPTEAAVEVGLTDAEWHRIAKLRQRKSAAKERKRLANQKDIPNRDVYTLSTDLIHRLDQWSKGWPYLGRRVDLPISNCAAFLLYDTVDKESVRAKARDLLTPRDHRRWNHMLLHPNDRRGSERGRGPEERRIIFQLSSDLIEKIDRWSLGFGNHIVVSKSQAVAFLLYEALEVWKAKPKPVHEIHQSSNNYWKLSLVHSLDPRRQHAN